MKAIRLYRHPGCAACARIARIHHRLDWLGRFEYSTAVPSTGALRMGEIAVEDVASGVTRTGVECFRVLCRNTPAYWPCLLLLPLPAFRRYVDRKMGACDGPSCALPSR